MVNEGHFASVLVAEAPQAHDLSARLGGRRRVSRRVIEAMIDEALDRARVRPEQRGRIYRARNRALTAVDDYLEDSDAALGPRVEAALRELVRRRFAAVQVEAALVGEEPTWSEDRLLIEILGWSLREAYLVLSPAQREIVADYVRTHVGERA